jgi:hypothetical protein
MHLKRLLASGSFFVALLVGRLSVLMLAGKISTGDFDY